MGKNIPLSALGKLRGVATLELLVASLLVGSTIAVSGLLQIHSEAALTRALSSYYASNLLAEWLVLHELTPTVACASAHVYCPPEHASGASSLDSDQAEQLLEFWEQQLMRAASDGLLADPTFHATSDYVSVCWQPAMRAGQCLVRMAAQREMSTS